MKRNLVKDYRDTCSYLLTENKIVTIFLTPGVVLDLTVAVKG